MWKSRRDKLPPAQYFGDLLQQVRNLYPGAKIDESFARSMRDIWIAEWRNGQSAQDTAKATCSCDGKTVVPSAGAGRDLGKRLARPPQGAKRGDFIAPENLREVTPLANARREAEKYAQAFDRVRGAAMKLLQTQGWTAAKGVRLQELRTLLQELKTKHDAAVAKYQAVVSSRRETKQPDLYAKPLGALGLSLRPDELPEPPPPKQKKPPKEKRPPKEKKPPKEKAPPKEKRALEPKAKPGAALPAHPLPAKLLEKQSDKSKDEKDCNCKKPQTKAADAPAEKVKVTRRKSPPSKTDGASSAQPSNSTIKPKRERKQKSPPPSQSVEPPKPALSDAEAEELANLFAAASAEDKTK